VTSCTKEECDICQLKCETCYSPADNHCLSCKKGFTYLKKTNQCFKINESFKKDEIVIIDEFGKLVLKKCHQSCVECDGINSNDCTKCLPA